MTADQSAITERSPPKLLVLTLFTLGIYWLVHISRINREFKRHLDADYNAGLRTFSFLIPLANFYTAWTMGQTAHEVNEEINPGLAAVGFLIPLIGAFVIQPELNAVANGE